MKQTRHKRKYKSGKIRTINPHNVKRRSYSMYPLGKERQLKIVWDKERLKHFYEDEKRGDGMDERPEKFVEEKIQWDDPKKVEAYDSLMKKMMAEKAEWARDEEENMYLRHAEGVQFFDPDEKQTIIEKIPYNQLTPAAKLEVKLVKGGFFNPETEKILTSYGRRKNDRKMD